MRLQQLALRVQDETRLRFHERLTVITGIGPDDRQGLVEVILGTLAGESTVSSELAYVERTGQRVTVDQTPEGTFHVFHDDGTTTDPPSVLLGMSVRELFDLVYVDARQLSILQQGPSEPRELGEARSALAALTDQLDAAMVARDAADALRVELVALDEEIRQIEIGRPRRRYARLVLQLEALKAERAAVTAPSSAEADRVTAAHLALLRPLAARWRAAQRHLSDARQAFGDRVRLDAETLAGALAVPDRVPPNLDTLVDELAAAEAVRASVASKLAGMMADHVDTPSHPDIPRLARADQDRLWHLAERAAQTGLRLEEESLRLGGLAPEGEADGETPRIVKEIESAHEAVELAQEVVEKRKGVGVVAVGGAAAIGAVAIPFAPLVAPIALAGSAAAAYWAVLAPRQQLAEAQDWETDTLIRAGVPSYLSFHLRRMQAMQDPTLRAPLERAAREHRTVMHAWRLLAGDIAPAEALKLEREVRAYAASVSSLGGLGDDVTETRRRLVEEIEPAVERARENLLQACRPFGIENVTLAADLVRQLVEVARVARLQQAMHDAEREELEARRRIEEPLAQMGLVGVDDVSAALAAFEEHAAAADQRVRYRVANRAVREIDREIERVEAHVVSERRTEYGTTFTAADAREPEPHELQSRREMTAMAFHTAMRLVPDIDRIADRKAALERRVAFLESEFGDTAASPSAAKVTEIERELQHRLARLRHCGRSGESLPLLMDECFVNLRPDVKWAMLDLVDRLSGHAQVVYMTNDPDVPVWARRRAAAGTVTFLDPLRQPVC
ncbi:MAG TPA: hypothetical protein VF230_18885 [Acidimicrobiales bacterium]